MFRIYAGSSYAGEGTAFKFVSLQTHPNYDSKTSDYDVAVIKVNKPFNSSMNMVPIPLASENIANKVGLEGLVLGWGRLSV